jgi:glycosyltransferase involved in cell wall biosynthesis
MQKKVLYIGHKYHLKTHSTDFFVDIVKSKYELDYITYDAESDTFDMAGVKLSTEYDAVIIFQMPVPIDELNKMIHYKKGVYVPMYDGTGEAPDSFWLEYVNFTIINFSKTLHRRLLKMGFSSYYIQYFPEPSKQIVFGEDRAVFFWHRRGNLNIDIVLALIGSYINKIHYHKALDPGEQFDDILKTISDNYIVTFSTWYEKKEDMLIDMQKASIYIAPREYEGIGMSFLEAMAMGKCVIAPNHPTMNEYIKHGVNGFLYDIRNPSELLIIDIRKIQTNTYRYISKGYKKWEKDKVKILEWIEAPLISEMNLFAKILHGYKVRSCFNTLKIKLKKLVKIILRIDNVNKIS